MKRQIIISVVLLLLVLPGQLLMAADEVIIRAGHLIDPATGEVTSDQIIVVTGQRITAVGADVEVPEGSQVIDLSDSWVLPGLMDEHVHLTFNAPPGGDFVWEYYTETTAFRALRGAHNARLVLEAGFTTVKDIGNSANYAMVAVRRAIAEGWYVGPTIFDAGKIIAPFGGQSRNLSPEHEPGWRYEYIDADTPDEVRKAVRQNIYYGANTIKLVSDNNLYYYTEEEIRAAVEEAGRAGMRVAVHTGGGQAATNVILGGAHAIEHGTALTDEHLKLMKKHGTVLAGTEFPPDHLAAMGTPDAEERWSKVVDRLRRAHEIGVTLVYSTDSVVNLDGKTRAQMNIDFLRSWIAADIPPSDILKSMITNNAELFGISDERGLIKAGMKADIIATSDNPLTDINALRAVKFVMKDGALIKGAH